MNNERADKAAADLIPDFCRWRPLLLLALILELVAVVLTLVQGADPAAFERFVLVSLYLQWIGLCSGAVLCAARRKLRHAPLRVVFFVDWVLLVAVSGLVAVGAYEILLRLQPAFAASPEPRYSFLFRHLSIGAIVSLMVLHYFWLQHQWRQHALAESESRYQALQARMRPHFLFNSLNSIAALAGSRPEEAETLIEDMSELLRASLDGRSRLVPLADELALVRAYLRIEQARLGERLRVDWEVPDEAMLLDVPLLTVQPLVENAVYHGVERRAGESAIRIAAQRQGSMLVIEVANPCPDAGAVPHQGQRLAIDNIAQRLALIYGGRARLQLGIEGERYMARLHLPLVNNR